MLRALAVRYSSRPCVPRRSCFTDEGGDRDASTLHADSHPSPGVSMAQLSRLPKPLISSYEWQWHATCAERNPHMFFHPEGERGPAREQRDRAAVAVCVVCPVVED